MEYFPSAESMAADLQVDLLLRADIDRRMLTRKDRLSQFVSDPLTSGHFHGKVCEEHARKFRGAGLRGRVLWVTAPYGTTEHLSWVAGLADQITREKGRVYLAASEVESLLPARSGARGEGLPDTVAEKLRDWLEAPSYAVGTDLEGVRVVIPITSHDAVGSAPEARDWTVILLDPLPEDYDGPYPDAEHVDAVIVAAAFRDHSAAELRDSVDGLKRAGLPILGVVAIGPKEGGGEASERGASTRKAASIWREPDFPPAPPETTGSPRLVAVPGTLGRSRPGEPAGAGAGGRGTDPEESTWGRIAGARSESGAGGRPGTTDRPVAGGPRSPGRRAEGRPGASARTDENRPTGKVHEGESIWSSLPPTARANPTSPTGQRPPRRDTGRDDASRGGTVWGDLPGGGREAAAP
ncbi:MAG: hypothetical protein KC729_16830, partial [Candidatus Eisenbacteria bacterium]|nr:hypothetical protein [Candidatus Eisenbacteria bacterium]